ncbi:MAG: aminotransferase class I/II-fold pyridoxal phosphate-dependent enzyme [Acidimicrobiales bacterium]
MAGSATGKAIHSAGDLVTDVELRIGVGHLLPGERVAPVRALAAELGLAPNTVAAAYRTLGERGVLVGRGRRGTFVADRPPVAHALVESLPDGLVDLARGHPDPSLLPPLGPALAAIDAGHVLYDAPPVDAALADAVPRIMGHDGIGLDHVAVVSGALDGIERVLAAHLRPGDPVAVEDPGYGPVTDLVGAMRLRPLPMAVDECGPMAAAVAAAIDGGCRAVVVTPRAHNPTGAAVDAGRAAELAAVLATADDVVVIEDDHAWAVSGAPYHRVVPPGAPRWATVRSVAKSLGPDLRLAVLAGDETTVGRVTGRQALGPGWVSHLLQRLVAELLCDPTLDDRLAAAAAAYTDRRRAVVEPLRWAGVAALGRSGMNVWVPVADEAAVVAGMQRHGFAVRSGARFRLVGPPGIRLSVAAADSHTLADATAALLEVLGPGAGTTRSA